ncbi:MAG: SdpI family protein [Pseudohongiellaceae bacterium]
MKFILANALSLICLAAMILVGVIMYPGLPETVPAQYNFVGVADNYLPKQAVILVIPIAYAASIALIHLMIRYSPEKFAMPNSQRAMQTIVFGVGILLLSVHVGILIAEGDRNTFHQYFSPGIACFLIIMGNVIGKTERNFIAGIRIPWTLASTENWRVTHRFAGRLMVVSGLVLLVAGYLWPSLLLTICLGLGWLLASAIYSFLFYLKNERRASD